MKCSIPSFVSDFVSVQDWQDSEGLQLFENQNYGKIQPPSTTVEVLAIQNTIFFVNIEELSLFILKRYSFVANI